MNAETLNIYKSGNETVDTPASLEVSVPNMVRCPFYEEPVKQKQRHEGAKYAKRTQRHRSTAQSRLGDMTVGDIRYCFQQLRNAGKDLNPEMMLYNGQSAGEFALKYLRETSTAMRKRRKKLAMIDSDTSGDETKEKTSVNDVYNSGMLGVATASQPRLNILEF